MPAQVVAVPATDWQVVTRLGRLDPQQPVVVSVGGEKIRTFPGSDLWCDGIPAATVSAGGCDEDVAVTLVARASDDEMTYRVVVAGVPTEYVVGPRADRTTTAGALAAGRTWHGCAGAARDPRTRRRGSACRGVGRAGRRRARDEGRRLRDGSALDG